MEMDHLACPESNRRLFEEHERPLIRRMLMASLNPLQKQVLHQLFWKNRIPADIARDFGKSRTWIGMVRDQAFRSIARNHRLQEAVLD